MAAEMENAAEERDKATEDREAQEQFRRRTLSLTTIGHDAVNIVVAEVHMQQSSKERDESQEERLKAEEERDKAAKARDVQEAFTHRKSVRYISHL